MSCNIVSEKFLCIQECHGNMIEVISWPKVTGGQAMDSIKWRSGIFKNQYDILWRTNRSSGKHNDQTQLCLEDAWHNFALSDGAEEFVLLEEN